MSQSKTIYVQGSSPFFALLAVLFIGLKLTGYVTWSWLWVLAPIWGPMALVLVVLAVVVAAVVVKAAVGR